ncbi:MAG: ATP-binding cassette domain-containing protein [Acidimicrobiia bacterium]|nr:ATP-binding cassette domain-containing protein [Acidimicrobiia bacterium]
MARSSTKVGRDLSSLTGRGLSFLSFVLGLALWEVLVDVLEIPRFLFPPPSQVFQIYFTGDIRWLDHTLVTLRSAVTGCAIGVAFGFLLAVLITVSEMLSRIVMPYVVALQVLPKVAIAPILYVMLGFTNTSRVILIVILTFFPIVINVSTGLSSVDRNLVYLLNSLGAGNVRVFYKVRLPNSLPYFLDGLRIAVSGALVGAIVAEFVSSNEGLGFLILNSQYTFNTTAAFGAFVILTILGWAPPDARGRTRMTTARVVVMEGVGKRYPTAKGEDVDAVADVSFEVRRGETLAIVGPSGCGKSTLLRLIAGVDSPTEGTIERERSDGRFVVGYVFQESSLMQWRTVYDNIKLPLEVVKDGGSTDNVDDLIRMIGMKGFENSYPIELSGGMQRRVSLARAFVHGPSIVLMDEPFTGVDELTKEALQHELGTMIRDLGATAMLVTHDIEEAVFLSHRILIMSPRPGSIVAEVPVDLPPVRDPSMRTSIDFFATAKAVREKLLEMHVGNVRPSE